MIMKKSLKFLNSKSVFDVKKKYWIILAFFILVMSFVNVIQLIVILTR